MIHLCVCDIHVCIIYYYMPVLCRIVYKLTYTYTQDTRWRGGSSVSVLIGNLPIDYLLIIQSVSLEKVHGMVLYYLITEWKFNSVRMKFHSKLILRKNSAFTSLSQAYWWEVLCDWLEACNHIMVSYTSCQSSNSSLCYFEIITYFIMCLQA